MSDKKNLSIPFPTFGACPFELVDQGLDEAGIDYVYAHLLYVRLFGVLDWSRTIRIGCHDFMLGFTGYLSDKALVKLLRVGSNNTARKAMKMLLDAGLVKQYQKIGDKCPHYKIMLFEPVIEFLKENPPETIKVEYLTNKEVFDARFKHTQKDNPKPKQSHHTNVDQKAIDRLTETCASDFSTDAPDAHNQDSSKIHTLQPTPPLDLERIEGEGEEGRLDQSERTSQAEPDARDSPKDEKASQRQKHTGLPFSDVFQVVTHWLGERNDYTPEVYRRELAHQFGDKINKFVLPAAVRHTPDHLHLSCVDVMKIWIDTVKSRRKPAYSVNYIDTEPGMNALIDAMRQVLGSIAEVAEMEMDPTLVEMWKEKWGENWREKRREAMRNAA